MQKLTIYHEPATQELTIVETAQPQETDAAFLDMWLFGKSAKTQRAYTSDMLKFYAYVGKSLVSVTL